MAQPYIQPTQDPNYLGYSREISAPPVDQSYGKLFENIGNLLGSGAKGVDTLLEDSAKKDARKIVQERIQDPYTSLTPPEAASMGNAGTRANAKGANANGVPSADETSPDGGADDELPPNAKQTQGLFEFLSGKPDPAKDTPGGSDVRSPMAALRGDAPVPEQVQGEIDSQMTQLNRLQQGRNVGIITPTYLYTQYTAAAKALYSKYPGYEDVIDQEFHKLTGVVPANAQIQAIMQNFNNLETAGVTAQSKWEAEVKSSASQAGMGGALAQQGYAAYGDPQKMLAFRMQYQNLMKSKVDVANTKARLEVATADHTVTEQDQKQALTLNGSRMMGQIMMKWRAADGSTFQDLTQRLFEYSQKTNLTPDEKQSISLTINQLNTAAQQALDEHFRSDAYATIDPQWKVAAKAQVMGPITDLANAWDKDGAKGLAVAGLVARHVEDMGTGSADQIVKSSTLAQMWLGLSKAGGAGGAQALVPIFQALTSGQTKDAQGRPVPPIDKLTSDAIQTLMLHGVNNQGSFFKDIAPQTPMAPGQKPTADATPQALNAKIHAVTDVISDKNVSDTQKANMATYLSTKGATDFVLSFKPEEQAKVLAALTTPAVTNEVYRLGQSNPAVWEQYKNWAKDSMMASVSDSRGVLAQALHNPALNVQWDNKTNQFTWQTPGPRLDQFGRPMQVPYAPADITHLQNVNAALKTLQVIYSKDGETVGDKLIPQLGLKIPGYAPAGEGPQTPGKTNLQPTGKEELANPMGSAAESISKYVKSKQDNGNFDEVENRFKPNQAHVNERWGNPFTSEFKDNHLTPVQAGGKQVLVNKVAAPAFQGFLKDLEATGYNIKSIGGWDIRSKKGNADSISQHAFGNAIDINPSSNAFGSTKTDMPPQVADLARKWGLSWGGQWKSTRDPMHFEFSGK